MSENCQAEIARGAEHIVVLVVIIIIISGILKHWQHFSIFTFILCSFPCHRPLFLPLRFCIVIDFEHSLASPSTDLVALVLLLLLRISISIFTACRMLNVAEYLPHPSLNMLRFFLALPFFVFNSRNCLNFYFRMCDLISVANGCQGESARGWQGTAGRGLELWHYKWYWKRCVYGPFNTMATQRAHTERANALLLNGAYDLYFILFFVFFVFVFALM